MIELIIQVALQKCIVKILEVHRKTPAVESFVSKKGLCSVCFLENFVD